MRTNYDFWYIIQDDNGFVTEVAIHFYEGEYRDVVVKDVETMKDKIVNRYVRVSKLKKEDLKHLDNKFVTDTTFGDAKIYRQEDFGKIKTTEELQVFLDKELVKDKGREPIVEQTIKIKQS